MSNAVRSVVYAADNSAFSTNTIALGIMDSDLIGELAYAISQGKMGTRQPYACRSRVVAENIVGGFRLKPTAAELDWLIERIIGDNISGYPASAAEPGETVPAFYLWMDKGGEQTFRYNAVRADVITLSGQEGGEIEMGVGLVGVSEEQVTDLVSPPDVDCATQFILPDLVLDIGGTEFSIKGFNLQINNNFGTGGQENSITRQIFELGQMSGLLQVTTGYRSDTKALYRRGIAGDDDVTLVLDDGTDTYTITLGNIKAPDGAPTIPEEGELTTTFNFVINRTETAPLISIAKS